MVTSSGMSSRSMSMRMKSKSVSDAEGKPTSISLKPMEMSRFQKRSLRSESMGLTSAWLPSRRSTEHQRGARVRRLPGHVRSGKSNGTCLS